jgi:hypothetical protein
MEENAKKTFLIGAAVACIAVAGIIMYKTMGGGAAPGQPAGKIWLNATTQNAVTNTR